MLFKNMCHNWAVFIMYVVLLRTNRMKYVFDCFFICVHFSELNSPEWAPNVIDACELAMGACDAMRCPQTPFDYLYFYFGDSIS